MTMRTTVLPINTFSIVLDLNDSGAIYRIEASPDSILSNAFLRST